MIETKLTKGSKLTVLAINKKTAIAENKRIENAEVIFTQIEEFSVTCV